MVQVTELGYVGIGVKDLAAWKNFASELLGAQVVEESAQRAYLRMDYWHHRLIVDEDGSDDLQVVGLRVAGREEFQAMQAQLRAGGIDVAVCTKAEAEQRCVLELMRLTDPAGIPIEIFHGPLVQADKPFHPGRGLHGRFVTGAGGLGHCILAHSGLDTTYDFYRLLGMNGGIEYKVQTPQGAAEILFMHCNDRDHTFAFGVPAPKRINHMMFEYDNLDDVGLAYDIAKRMQVPIAIAPGRHANDHMYSFYAVNPSGWQCEFGWGGRPATQQSEYYQRDTFGHEMQRPR